MYTAGGSEVLRPARSPQGRDSRFGIADCATTASIALSGTPTIDGQTTSGKTVLVKNQATPSQNGLYRVSAAGAWSKSGQPTIVFVKAGTLAAKTNFILTSANVYSGGLAYYG